MAMHVLSEGNKSISLRQNLRLLLTLFELKPHIIIMFHLKTNMQKLEKYHVNGSQTCNFFCESNKFERSVVFLFFLNNL